MRQAGRYMPEYRAVRARMGFLELCKHPEAAAQSPKFSCMRSPNISVRLLVTLEAMLP